MAGKNSFQEILQNAVNGLSEEEAKRLLRAEGQRLKEIAIKKWRQYLASYTPKMYVRTGNSEKAIKLGDVKRISPTEWGIELTWENSLAYHDSVLPNSNKKGHAVMLISSGWHAKKLEKIYGKRVYRHTYFEGTGYLYQVYKEYMKSAPKTVTLDVQWSGKAVKSGR